MYAITKLIGRIRIANKSENRRIKIITEMFNRIKETAGLTNLNFAC